MNPPDELLAALSGPIQNQLRGMSQGPARQVTNLPTSAGLIRSISRSDGSPINGEFYLTADVFNAGYLSFVSEYNPDSDIHAADRSEAYWSLTDYQNDTFLIVNQTITESPNADKRYLNLDPSKPPRDSVRPTNF